MADMQPKSCLKSVSLVAGVSALALVATLVLADPSRATAPNANQLTTNKYTIKTREVANLNDGLRILRSFMANSMSQLDRCQRYAVALNNYYKLKQMDQFRLASIGLAQIQTISESFKKITMDSLRDLYMQAIQKQLEGSPDSSFLEIVDCLKKKFNNHDAKARSFLNNKQLQRTIEQYRSIMGMQIDFLLDEQVKHPSLRFDDLEPSVQKTVVDLFNGDQAEARAHFLIDSPPIPTPVPLPITVATPAAAAATASLTFPPKRPEPAPIATELPNRITERTPITMPTFVPFATPAPALAPEVNKAQVPEADPTEDRLSKEGQALLKTVIDLLKRLYDTLPVDSKLSDRCQVYAKVITSEPSNLNEQLVLNLVAEVEAKLKAHGASESKYLPGPEVRENFLFTVGAFPPKRIGDAMWMDLVDCISQWESDDERVGVFLMDPPQYLEHLANGAVPSVA